MRKEKFLRSKNRFHKLRHKMLTSQEKNMMKINNLTFKSQFVLENISLQKNIIKVHWIIALGKVIATLQNIKIQFGMIQMKFSLNQIAFGKIVNKTKWILIFQKEQVLMMLLSKKKQISRKSVNNKMRRIFRKKNIYMMKTLWTSENQCLLLSPLLPSPHKKN